VRLGRQLYGVLIADARLVVTGKCVGVAAAVAAAGVRTRRGQGLGLGRVHGFWASWPGSRFRGGGEGIRPRSGYLTGTRAVPKVRLSARGTARPAEAGRAVRSCRDDEDETRLPVAGVLARTRSPRL